MHRGWWIWCGRPGFRQTLFRCVFTRKRNVWNMLVAVYLFCGCVTDSLTRPVVTHKVIVFMESKQAFWGLSLQEQTHSFITTTHLKPVDPLRHLHCHFNVQCTSWPYLLSYLLLNWITMSDWGHTCTKWQLPSNSVSVESKSGVYCSATIFLNNVIHAEAWVGQAFKSRSGFWNELQKLVLLFSAPPAGNIPA